MHVSLMYTHGQNEEKIIKETVPSIKLEATKLWQFPCLSFKKIDVALAIPVKITFKL